MDRRIDEKSSKSIKSLHALAAAESECHRRPLYRDATQAVPGEGPKQADFMLVGEQPGDKEDLAGKPFVGPADRILDAALEDAGIRCKIWLERERDLVKPATIIALGVTAARSLTGKMVTIAKSAARRPSSRHQARRIHPSALLRIEDESDKHAAYRAFVADLKAARVVAGKAAVKR